MKFYFLDKTTCSLSAEVPDILREIEKELIDHRGYQRAGNMASADVILLQEAFSFKNWRYLEVLKNNAVIKQYVEKIYTINTDDAATGLLKGIYPSITKSRFDKNIHRAVPYFYFPNKLLLQVRNEKRAEPTYLACWRGNLKSNVKLRKKIFQTYAHHPDFNIETTESWLNHPTDEQERYVNLLKSGKFSLCPAGWAPGSFRIFESMALGICPVIIADEYAFPEGVDWSKFSIQIEQNEIKNIYNKLISAEPSFRELGSEARTVWDKNFHPYKVMSYYTDQLLNCIHSSLGLYSSTDEYERWQSRKMFTTNNWTLTQRIQNKMRKISSKAYHKVLGKGLSI